MTTSEDRPEPGTAPEPGSAPEPGTARDPARPALLALLARAVPHRHHDPQPVVTGRFRHERCRCNLRRIRWLDGRGRTLWTSRWGTADDVRRELARYSAEASHPSDDPGRP